MGKTSRKKYTSEFKAQVAIEALNEQATLAELAKKYDVSPTMILHWKAGLANGFLFTEVSYPDVYRW